jgi:hypothetical protein
MISLVETLPVYEKSAADNDSLLKGCTESIKLLIELDEEAYYKIALKHTDFFFTILHKCLLEMPILKDGDDEA